MTARTAKSAVVVAALLGAAAPAAADRIIVPVPGQPARLAIDDAWRVDATPAAADGPAVVMRHPSGALLAVTVAIAPNTDAWRDRTRGKYTDAIVDAFAQDGVVVTSRRVSKVDGVPTVDVVLERDRRKVAVRLLLFRTRTVAIAVEGRRESLVKAAAHGLAPSTPPPDPDR